MITLFKDFAAGMTDYIERHKSNYSIIESNLNQLIARVTGQMGGDLAVPPGLKEIFDRPGIIGRDSYYFEEGTLQGPDYALEVWPGAYWDGGNSFKLSSFTRRVSMAGRETGTYYLYLDSGGLPAVSSALQTDTIYSFFWNATTKQVSQRTLRPGISILLDGDDYADMLTSEAKGKTFTRVADRLEEIEAGQDVFGGNYAQNLPHTGLNFRYKAGQVRNDSVVTATPAGQVALTDNATNYVEVDPATGAVSANTTGFTSGRIPLYQVVTAGGAISTVSDKRTPAVAGTGGGSGGGHTQNTDTGTTAAVFTIDMDAAGNPTGRAGIEVENGDNPSALLQFNRDTRRWQYSEDGGASWRNLGDVNLDLGAQRLTKYVPFDDPPEVFFEGNRGSSLDWETLEFSHYVGQTQFGITSIILKVFYRDSSPSETTYVKFRKGGGPYSPAAAYTVWSDATGDPPKPATFVLPVNQDMQVDFWVNASGTETATLQIFLLGYHEEVRGVGTQPKSVTISNINVGANSTRDLTLDNFCNRGLVHYLKVEETSGNPINVYDLHLYADAGLSVLLYKAEGIVPAQDPFEDWLPFWVYDAGEERKLRMRITNKDTTKAGVYAITIKAEQFA